MYIWNTNDQKNLNIFIVYIFDLLGSFLLTVVFVIYQSQIPKRFFLKKTLIHVSYLVINT